MADIRFQVSGFDRLKRVLDRMPEKFQQNTLKKAVNFAMSPALSAAKAAAPYDSGALAKSLKKRVWIDRQQGLVTGRIRPDPKYFVYDRGYPERPYKYNLPLLRKSYGDASSPPDRFYNTAFNKTWRSMLARFIGKAKREIPKDAGKLGQKGLLR
jgi:hypothetical protein